MIGLVTIMDFVSTTTFFAANVRVDYTSFGATGIEDVTIKPRTISPSSCILSASSSTSPIINSSPIDMPINQECRSSSSTKSFGIYEEPSF